LKWSTTLSNKGIAIAKLALAIGKYGETLMMVPNTVLGYISITSYGAETHLVNNHKLRLKAGTAPAFFFVISYRSNTPYQSTFALGADKFSSFVTILNLAWSLWYPNHRLDSQVSLKLRLPSLPSTSTSSGFSNSC
jgi:hypothetical protein